MEIEVTRDTYFRKSLGALNVYFRELIWKYTDLAIIRCLELVK